MRAGLYARVSTLKEAQQDSLTYQKEKGQVVAENLGVNITKIYIDDGKSGTKVKGRTEYQQMMRDIEKEEIDVIITKDVERLNRNLLEFCKMLDLAIRHNVKVYFYLTDEYYNFDNDTIIKIKAVLAEDYSKSLSVKSRDAHRDRQNAGRHAIFNNNTWGYKTVYLPDGSKKLVIDEKEAEMIRLIFNLCIQGFGTHRISKRLYAMGYRNHNGKIIGYGVVLGILRNPKVTGTVIFNKRVYDFSKKETIRTPESEWIIRDNVVPAIISKETFLLANSILDSRCKAPEAKRVNTRDNFKGSSRLSGKIICGECGAIYTRQARKLSKGDYVYDWICTTYFKFGRKTPSQYRHTTKPDIRLSKDGCDNAAIKQEVIYKVLDYIREEYFGSDNKLVQNTLNILEKSMELEAQNDTSQKELKHYEKQIAKVNKKINMLTEKFLENSIDKDTYKSMVSQYEEDRDRLKLDIGRLQKKCAERQNIQNRILEIRKVLEEGGEQEATVYTILEYIDKIYIYYNKVEVTFLMNEILGIENKALCDKISTEGKIVYEFKQSELKYKRQAMDFTNKMIYDAIKNDNSITNIKLGELTGFNRTTIHFRIKRFKELGYIRRVKPDNGGKMHWEILKEWDPDDERRIIMRQDSAENEVELAKEA